ncbi:MAG: hypothetical protein GHCLOJNM_01450 [bacterium]|nr:hypothetical protein [bacterium]
MPFIPPATDRGTEEMKVRRMGEIDQDVHKFGMIGENGNLGEGGAPTGYTPFNSRLPLGAKPPMMNLP